MANQLPLDTSGTSPDNKIQDEVQKLTKAGGLRSVAPLNGAFYTANTSLIVRDAANNAILTPGVDYYPTFLYELPSAFYEQEICGILMIKNPNVSDHVVLDYQALGGQYVNQDQYLVNMLSTLDDLGHDPKWGPIAKPVQDYPPRRYTTLLDRGVGFEYLRQSLGQLSEATVSGDSYGHDDILVYEDESRAVIEQMLLVANQQLAQHLADHGNPHVETAHQHGMYTREEIAAAINTTQDTYTQRIAQVRATIEAHISITAANPHNTTLQQLGMWTRQQAIDRINQAKASRPPSGVNGFWQLLVTYGSGSLSSWSHYNDRNQAAFYSVTTSNGGGRLGNSMYVDGSQISDAACYHTNWTKRIQTGLMVGSGSTFTIVTANVGQSAAVRGLRFVFN